MRGHKIVKARASPKHIIQMLCVKTAMKKEIPTDLLLFHTASNKTDNPRSAMLVRIPKTSPQLVVQNVPYRIFPSGWSAITVPILNLTILYLHPSLLYSSRLC